MQRSISTLSEEWNRNKVHGSYDPRKAQNKAYVRRRNSKYQGMKVVSNNQVRNFIESALLTGQSPENIAGRLRKEAVLPPVSKNSIYRFLQSPYGRQLSYYRSQTKRKRRRARKKYTTLPERTFIDHRPQHINDRQSIGDVEADFIVSGKQGKGILLVVVDRKSRASFLEKITVVSIDNVHKAFLAIQHRFLELTTITTDNDLLFRRYPELEKLLSVKIFFCHPYHSWEKGTVENTNGYIRRDIPKGSNISRYSKHFIRTIEDKLNNRFMKCLDYATPSEVLTKLKQSHT